MEKIEVRSCRLGQKKTAVTVAKFMGTPWAYLPISLPTFNAAWLAYEPYMERKGKLKLNTCPTAPKIKYVFLKQPLKHKFHSGYSKAPNLSVLYIYIYSVYIICTQIVESHGNRQVDEEQVRHAMADPEIQQILHVTWLAQAWLSNQRFAGCSSTLWVDSCTQLLHTIGGFWSRLAIQQLEDPQINMFLKEMQNNPREAQKQMMSDRAGCAFGAWRLDVWERLQVSWGVVI